MKFRMLRWTDEDFVKLLNQEFKTKILIVKIVDIFDFNGSFLPELQETRWSKYVSY